MDAVLALTDDDKTNILACVRAKTEGAKMVVALVNDPSLIGLIAPMGIDAYVNPRSTTVSARSCATSATGASAPSTRSATARRR